MLHNVIPVILEELNEYLKSRYGSIEDKVLLSNVVEQDGSVIPETKNKIIVSVVNVEEEQSLRGNAGNQNYGASFAQMYPPVMVNVHLMFTAMFKNQNYMEGLKYLSGVLYFFQSKPLFTAENTPDISENIDKLFLELMSPSVMDLMNICSMMGMKYSPSALYKLKLLPFNEHNVVDEIPGVSGISLDD